MNKPRFAKVLASIAGLVLSAAAAGATVEDRVVYSLDGNHGNGSAEPLHLLQVGGRDYRHDRDRDLYRSHDRRHDRHYRRHDHYRYRPYDHDRHHRYRHRYYIDGSERLLWYGLGVLTPYLLDDRY